MAATGNHGRTVKGKRGIGSGSGSHKTSTSKPGSAPGYPMTKGDGKSGKANPGKGKNSKKY